MVRQLPVKETIASSNPATAVTFGGGLSDESREKDLNALALGSQPQALSSYGSHPAGSGAYFENRCGQTSVVGSSPTASALRTQL